MLYGLPDTLLRKLQSVQNATAWLITGTRHRDHIMPVLHQLHWLPIWGCVKFKLACLVRQSLFVQASLYLADDCCLVSDSTQRSLQSADIPTCVVPRTLSSYGDRTFTAAGTHLWNSLPVRLRNPDITYKWFKQQLKGHLSGEPWTWCSVTSDIGCLRKNTYLLTYLHARMHKSARWQNTCTTALAGGIHAADAPAVLVPAPALSPADVSPAPAPYEFARL